MSKQKLDEEMEPRRSDIEVKTSQNDMNRMNDENDTTENKVTGNMSAAREPDDEPFDPLFMDGLPADFSSNSKLAAIASFLNSDSDNESVNSNRVMNEKPLSASGGGKIKRRNKKYTNKNSPYAKIEKKTSNSASIGEAQLFLSMWKM
ncbi:hypothetical protein CTEN210_15627 [Chaetoceros tenuissimus]|uniref:Uncharacterized protein n=1 Tax=Chaetoceros tenuissimus TaxID=426638 RepID=A0AAD3D9H5_9STRA|nr:hypothetical protein CTEN210_15627 [Chaetoceros tenuissimus]